LITFTQANTILAFYPQGDAFLPQIDAALRKLYAHCWIGFSKQEAAILNHALEQILLNARKSFAGIGMQP